MPGVTRLTQRAAGTTQKCRSLAGSIFGDRNSAGGLAKRLDHDVAPITFLIRSAAATACARLVCGPLLPLAAGPRCRGPGRQAHRFSNSNSDLVAATLGRSVNVAPIAQERAVPLHAALEAAVAVRQAMKSVETLERKSSSALHRLRRPPPGPFCCGPAAASSCSPSRAKRSISARAPAGARFPASGVMRRP